MVSSFLRNWFGDFSKEELKKFIKLGVIFGLIIGIYWTLRSCKDPVFQTLVGPTWQPIAKMVSMVAMVPLLMLYSYLLDKFSRNQVFYILSIGYGMLFMLFGGILLWYGIGSGDYTAEPSALNIIGWSWYVFVESFGSLLVALFWAFSTDITSPESGKRGFSVVVMIGQLGGVFIPFLFLKRLMKLKYLSTSSTIIVMGFLVLVVAPLVWYFLRSTPKELLVGFKSEEDNEELKEEKSEGESGFLDGLRLMLSKPYLLAIFTVIFFYEVIVTVIDYHFKLMAAAKISDVNLRTSYLGGYGIWTNTITFLCLFFGISNITRRLGVTTALSLIPIFTAICLILFRFYGGDSLGTLFWIMVGAKGVNYALNGPAMKQLYIPVSEDVRYKSQAWIETFGSRGSKSTGGIINLAHVPLMNRFSGANLPSNLLYTAKDLGSNLHMAIATYFFLGICGLWFFIALYLGRTYQNAVDKNKIVC